MVSIVGGIKALDTDRRHGLAGGEVNRGMLLALWGGYALTQTVFGSGGRHVRNDLCIDSCSELLQTMALLEVEKRVFTCIITCTFVDNGGVVPKSLSCPACSTFSGGSPRL